jgi:Leucine-rich repeat (LRR) protein
VPPFPVDDFFDFDPTVTSSVTVDILSNDIIRELPIDTTTVQIVVPPSTGAATVDPLNGAITFTYAGDANLQETIQYRVADTEGNRSSVGSLSIIVDVLPTANAGVDQTAVSGATVTLDGSASNDLEGGPVTYSWVQINGPQVSLSNATAVNPTFAAALGDAVLEFALKVTADDGATATDTVTVTLTNVLPKANAGVDQTVASGVTATLDGSASNDLEGVVSYSWVQSSGPAVTLSNATVANPTFSAAFGYAVLEFSLTVTDVNGGTATDAVIVTLSQVISSLNIDDGNLFNCILDTGAHFAAHITSLSCPSRSIINLLGIEALGSLSTLDLSKNSIVDLAFLSSLTGLVYLDVSGNQVSDLSPLSGLVSLDHLLANNNEIVDLTPLGGLTALVHLNLDYNRVVDLSPLSGLSSLRLLTAGYNRIIDLTPVSSLTGLEHLAMASNRVMTLPPLSSAGLQWVDLHRNSIQGLSALSGLAGLEYLNVAHNRADDLSPLSGVVSLKTLRVGHNLIVDLTPLAGLTELVTLKAPHNLIADASPLSSLTQLSFLALNRNLLSTLPNLPISLTTLQAAHNQLVDIDALAGFTQLLELNLRDNHLINDEAAVGSALLTLTGLLTLDISNNAIDNFDALNSSALGPSSLITDEARPALTSLTLMPNDVIDLDKSLPELNVTITNSAATAGQFTLTSPTRSQVIFLPLNSNFDATYKFNEFADQGDWRVSDILFLTSPQRHQYNDFAIGHLYGPDPKAAFNADRVVSVSTSGSQTPDLEPPVLESLTITPSSVDLANGPALVDFTATFSDAPAGVAFSNLTIFDVDSNPLRSFSSSDGALSFRYMVGFTDESFRIGNISAHDFTWNQLALGFQQLIQAGFDVDVDVIGTLDPALRNSVTGPIFSEFKGRSSPHNPSYQFKVLTPGVVGVGFKWTDMGNDALLILRDEIGEELSSDGDFLFTLSPQLGLVLPVGIYSVELSANVNSESKTFFELTFLGDVTDIKRDSDGDGITDDVSEDDDGDGFLDADEITAGTDPLDPTDTPESSAKGDAAG